MKDLLESFVFIKSDLSCISYEPLSLIIFYQCAIYLVTVLSPLVGKTEHHVRNLNDLLRRYRNLR